MDRTNLSVHSSYFTISPMCLEDAKQIVQWRYESPYARYNMEDQAEDIEELLDGTYHAVRDGSNELIGFFCFGKNAQVKSGAKLGLYVDENALDIGLGLKPELTGQGKGTEFLKAGMLFAQEAFSPKKLRLSVAEFNSRAIALYIKLGFICREKFIHKHNGESTSFMLMETESLI